MEPDSIFLKGQSPWGTKKSMMTCGLWDFDFDTDPDTEEIKVIRNEYPVLCHPPNGSIGDPPCNLRPWIPA